MKTVYVCGIPGSGKTTIVDLALRLLNLQPVVEHIAPIPHVRHGTLWHLGRHRNPFGGTDTLAMNINPKAIAWVASLALEVRYAGNGGTMIPYTPDVPSVLLGEGDRLANRAFLDACPNLNLVWLDTPYVVAHDRATARAAEQRTPPQDAAWWKGRATKVSNLVNSRPCHRLDGSRPPAESAADLAAILAA